MKLDLLRIKILEKEYEANSICTQSLTTLIKLVLDYNNTPYYTSPDNVKLAINTLKELKVLIDDTINIQQLNS
jgi:hypothetical protein